MVDTNPSIALLQGHDSLTRDPKATADFSEDVDRLLERLDVMCWVVPGVKEEATECVAELEKKARQASDGLSVSRLCCKLMQLYKDNACWDALNEWVLSLSKKRGQLKRAIIDMVELGMRWVTTIEDKSVKLKLIQTLGTVADGNIYLEVEKARLVLLEVEMLEEEGKTSEAALLLQEVQVETFGGMERRERALYILEQLRLVLKREDYIRCQLISKKMNPKLLEAEDFQDIKLRYYNYLVDLHTHQKEYLSVANDYWQCFNTPQVKNTDDWKQYLTKYAVFLTLAPRSKETVTRIQTLSDSEKKRIASLPIVNSLVSDFLSTELVDWPLSYEADLLALDVFEDKPENLALLRTRIMQHNILVLSKYYTRIHTAGAARLLGISVEEVEEHISQLVYSDSIHAWIDRPAGFVSFGKPKTYCEKLDSWAADISTLLELVQETTHLINNSRMVRAAMDKRRQLREKAST